MKSDKKLFAGEQKAFYLFNRFFPNKTFHPANSAICF